MSDHEMDHLTGESADEDNSSPSPSSTEMKEMFSQMKSFMNSVKDLIPPSLPKKRKLDES